MREERCPGGPKLVTDISDLGNWVYNGACHSLRQKTA